MHRTQKSLIDSEIAEDHPNSTRQSAPNGARLLATQEALMAEINAEIEKIWLLNVEIVLTAYLAISGGVWFVLWVVRRKSLSRQKIRPERPPFWQLILEMFFSARSVILLATISVAVTLLARAGFYPLADLAAQWGPLWFVFSIVLMITGQDAYIYWIHRWMHRSNWYDVIHRRHHRSNNPSPFTAYSFNVGEALLLGLFGALWPVFVPTPWAAGLIVFLHQTTRNAFLHCGYELMPARANGRPRFDWMTTTTHHDLHHANDGHNFSPWFTWWDRWMGTEHPDYHEHYARSARRPLPQLRDSIGR
jgi:sterol desaturase/sphingolipid hydroxylase (fatty acid hydroxylase superfamily)